MCDLETATVEFVAPDRRTESLTAYYDSLTPTQRTALQAVADGHVAAYIRATTEGLPEGDERIVFDRFHIMYLVHPRPLRGPATSSARHRLPERF